MILLKSLSMTRKLQTKTQVVLHQKRLLPQVPYGRIRYHIHWDCFPETDSHSYLYISWLGFGNPVSRSADRQSECSYQQKHSTLCECRSCFEEKTRATSTSALFGISTWNESQCRIDLVAVQHTEIWQTF